MPITHKTTNILLMLAITTCLALFNTAQAATIGFAPALTTLEFGQSGQLDLQMDFSVVNDESLGGTFRINYDASLLTNVAFAFDANLQLNFGIENTFYDDSVNHDYC